MLMNDNNFKIIMMKPARSRTPSSARKVVTRSKCETIYKDPVQVYCRLRPLVNPTDVGCMKIVSESAILITPPESAINFRNANKVIQTSFSKVFSHETTQREVFEVVTLPLLQNLVHGKNGLLFTYGTTGSGKTYTMTGNSEEYGIMQHCIDVFFKNILNYQSKRYLFKPNKLNGFDVQSDSNVMLDEENNPSNTDYITNRIERGFQTPSSQSSDDGTITTQQSSDIPVLNFESDNVYAIFVTYIEIYNNSIYDLLEEDEIKSKNLQSKLIREDGNKNMYIHGVTEIEIKNTTEAFELFHRGQRRRRIAYTALNAESSRSHSVFNIRLVQCPFDSKGEKILSDKRLMQVSQLSLVDLAGSERTSRSKITGQRLREAGNINNSLLTLRTCLEILRENQKQETNRIVPYRESKLTHLFKNYFDGEGQVKMIVCVNPSADDYDETIQVMRFAEMTQEVQIARPVAMKLDLGYLSGRRNANKIFKEARSRLEKEGYAEAADLEVDIGLVYSFGATFPDLEVRNPHDEYIIPNLMRFLEQRIAKRNALRSDSLQKQNNLRNILVQIEHDSEAMKIENTILKSTNVQQKKKISALENHVCKTEAQIDNLIIKLNNSNDTIRNLQRELHDRDLKINQRLVDKQRVKQKYTTKIQVETNKMNKELEERLRQQREHLENQMKDKEDKLKLVKQILGDEENVDITNIMKNSATSTSCIQTKNISTSTAVTNYETTTSCPPISESTTLHSNDDNLLNTIPVVNPRYRRSQSAERWLEHRPGNIVPVGTILQPLMKNCLNVTGLIDPKDVISRTSRYCLVSQTQDRDGELETNLYKGDILPTCGGGAQVVFKDMECLKQISPISNRKRNSPSQTKLDLFENDNKKSRL